VTYQPARSDGADEAGAIGAPPALVNAVADALTGRGIEHFDAPLTRGRLWRAISVAEQRKAA
jgi:carbon-monoxide dehydrogenase large subunit